VRYLALVSMLLNELQKQSRRVDRQTREIRMLSAQVAALKTGQRLQQAAFEQRIEALERASAYRNTRFKLAAAFANGPPSAPFVAQAYEIICEHQ